MNDELISLKTALIKKEVGIVYPAERCFVIDKKIKPKKVIDIHRSTINEEYEFITFRQTQTALAKILREKYDTIIVIDYGYGFNCRHWHYKIITNKDIILLSNTYYSNYEEALEEALHHALILILKKKINS